MTTLSPTDWLLVAAAYLFVAGVFSGLIRTQILVDRNRTLLFSLFWLPFIPIGAGALLVRVFAGPFEDEDEE
jgi:hypothetical protein